ncbi:MAG: FHA domain-containing protein [Nannocystaceae bacterium]|nr:FHA domain-containing protein [Nannocystaceae bacterium]
MCGTEAAAGSANCGVCGYAFARSAPSNLGGIKCARCGSAVEHGFDFCPICGQNQRERFARPDTRILQVDGDPVPPDRSVPAAPGGAAMPPASMQPVAMPPAAMPPAAMPPAAMPPVAPTPGFAPGEATFGYGTGPAPVSGGPEPPPPLSSPMYPPMAAAPAAPPSIAPAPPAPPPMLTQPGVAATPAERTQFAPGPPMPPAVQPSSGVDRTVAAPPVLRRPDVSEDDRTIPAPPGRSRASEAPRAAAPDDAPTTAFDPRQVAASMAASPPPPRRPDEQTREGAQPHGPWSPSGPSQPVVGVRAQASTPTSPGATPRLVLVGRDGSEGEKFAVVGDRLTIGRRSADVLFADDDFLSPTHARIERSGEHYWLVDTGSQNGVFLRIHGTSPIYPGDAFMVGHQLLRVENVDGPTEEQPPDELGTRLFGTPLQPAWGKLVVIGRGGIRGDQFGLRGARLVVGREGGDIIFPNDPFLSREHARLRLELNGSTMSVFLEDLNSANGTYIRIRGAAELHNRDTFRIGDQIIRFRLD